MAGYLDAIFVPLSLLLMVGYHVYLCYCLKKYPSNTIIGVNSYQRRVLLSDIMKDGERKSMLAVQTIRNTQMASIFNASVAILVNTALAALSNNSYKASHLHNHALLGSKSYEIVAIKYASTSFILLSSFFCSSSALALFMDANYSITAFSFDHDSTSFTFPKVILERGNLLALIGNRLLWLSFPLLLWMLGPLPLIFSSAAMIWWLYDLDFLRYINIVRKKCHK
ncbi:hypothetical protein G4B88_003193 [Cannabis sativa]|uniref:Uncharacterized protein n=1 Tax=Cannabis sativa TaxID=3483 RepID=A0A7J6I3U6_CANSA|nr:hypothetical protein G4B88_003193 [Cannabis sativa]